MLYHFKRAREQKEQEVKTGWFEEAPLDPGRVYTSFMGMGVISLSLFLCPKEHYQNHASFSESIFNAELFFPAELLLAHLKCQVVSIKCGSQ